MYPPNPVSFPSTPPASTPPPTTPPATQTPFNGTIRTGPEAQVTLLPIFPVILQENGIIIHTYAMLDTGSEITMIAQGVAKQLKLQGPAQDRENLGVATVIASRVVSFTVRACRDCLGCWARHCFVFPRTTSTDRSFRLAKLLRMTVTLTVQTATHFFFGVHVKRAMCPTLQKKYGRQKALIS